MGTASLATRSVALFPRPMLIQTLHVFIFFKSPTFGNRHWAISADHDA